MAKVRKKGAELAVVSGTKRYLSIISIYYNRCIFAAFGRIPKRSSPLVKRVPTRSTKSSPSILARIFHELLLRDHEDGRSTWQPQGVGSEAYLNGTSQGPTPEDARKDDHIRGRSK